MSSNDLNKCLFIGRLGADPELRYTGNGTPVANFRIAVGSTWKDKQTGDKMEQTEWVSCVAWNKLAEICEEFLRKGKQVYICGRLQTRKWEDKDGKDRYTTEVVVDELQLLADPSGNAREERSSRPPTRGTARGPSRGTRGTTRAAEAPPSRRRAPEPTPAAEEEFDDDIPFGDEEPSTGGRW